MDEAHEAGGPVDHGGVDDLALPGGAGLEEGADHAEGEVHAASAEVAHQVHGRHRPGVVPTEVGEHAGEGDVVDVVSGHRGVGAFLAPPGHAAVDEGRVAGEAVVGADPEALGHAGAEALEEHVGTLHEAQHGLDALG